MLAFIYTIGFVATYFVVEARGLMRGSKYNLFVEAFFAGLLWPLYWVLRAFGVVHYREVE